MIDEARQAGRAAQTFPAADEDYFQGMDGGIALTPDEVKGRNMWLVWTGGNDRLWDKLTNLTFAVPYAVATYGAVSYRLRAGSD